MSIFARILVPVDGSPQSSRAVQLALEVAQAVGGAVTFCNVVDRSLIAVESSNVPFADPTPLVEVANSEGERLLADAFPASERSEAAAASSERLLTRLPDDRLYSNSGRYDVETEQDRIGLSIKF